MAKSQHVTGYRTVLKLLREMREEAGLTQRAMAEKVNGDAELRQRAGKALKDNPELRTVISASASASHGNVMHVLDTVRDAGITRVAFAADKLPATP